MVEILEKLRQIDGYKASAILDASGEIILKDKGSLVNENLDKELLTFNALFNKSKEVSKSLGLGSVTNMNLEAQEAVALMFCSGEDNRVHIHLVLILEKESNLGLAKLIANQVMEEMINKLRV
jgi:predicted regulator of Ras-like GTPase activity (Roadblock/LC7/MglB family)